MAKAMQPQKMRFSQAIQTPMYKSLVNNTLGDPARGARFIANITSAVAVNPALQECNPGTILAGALLGESLLLQPSPQFGQFYLVPFKSKAKRDRQGNVIEPASVKAQFVLGYKGYIQLALRTGQYKRLNVLEVKSGELSGWDPFEERFHEMHFIEDFEKRAAMPTVGYIAHFEYINGFEKTLYWTADQMMAHADKYSQAFSAAAYKKLLNGEIPQDELWKYSSFWYKDFDGIKNWETAGELSKSNKDYNTTGKNIGLLYTKDADKMYHDVPMAFLQHAPQDRNLEIVINCEGRDAGMVIPYPLSACLVYGL